MKFEFNFVVKLILPCLLLFLSLQLSAQNESKQMLVDKYLKIDKVSDRILIVGSGSYYYTAVVGVITEKGIVCIDAGIAPEFTAHYREVLAKEFKRNDFKYLINTHGHYDHTAGNQAFNDVPIIAHENCKNDIVEFWNDTTRANKFVYKAKERLHNRQSEYEPNSEWWNFYESLLLQNSSLMKSLEMDFKYVYPSITFSDRMDLRLGDVTFQLIYFGKAHTSSDIMIYIPEEKTLLVGDLFDKGGEPDFDITNTKNAQRWYQVMDYVMKLKIEKVIYGHGLVFNKNDLDLFNTNIRKN